VPVHASYSALQQLTSLCQEGAQALPAVLHHFLLLGAHCAWSVAECHCVTLLYFAHFFGLQFE
jgi:hypothetical protein